MFPNYDPKKTIPKVVYQTCHNKNEIHPLILTARARLQRSNPDYTFVLYDDDECDAFIKDYNPNLFKIYKMINPKYGAALSDFFRYLVIYVNGGIYIDLKATILKPLNMVIRNSDRYLISHWDNRNPTNRHHKWGTAYPILNNKLPNGEFLQWAIIAAPHHPFLERVLQYVICNIYNYSIDKDGVGKEAVIKTTGPIPYTLALLECLKYTSLYRFTNIMAIEGFKYSIFPDPNMHSNIFKGHYSKQQESLILHN
jgi:mannosyltransferase OCH1-like enzyme